MPGRRRVKKRARWSGESIRKGGPYGIAKDIRWF